MKLATKKLFHNLLAIAVSVCMVCTMTPSLAWATGGSGVSSENSTINAWESEGGTTATGSTEVKAKVYDANFKFDSITPGMNYESKSDFVTAVTGPDRLEATFPKDHLPDNYTVKWYVQEVQVNPDFDPDQPESKDNPKTILVGTATEIASDTYTKANTPTTDNVPTFTYPGSAGVTLSPADLPMENGKRYEFSVVMTDGDANEASATTQISLLPDYPTQIVQGTPEANEDFSVSGNIFQDFTIPPAVSVLEVTQLPSDNATAQKIQTAAANNKNGAETVEEVSQLELINNAKPVDKDPYEGSLAVRISLPDSLKGADPAPAEGDKYNVYIADADGNVTVKEGEVTWAIDSEGNRLKDSEGNDIPVVIVDIEGTGVELGSFGIGVPVAGTYFMTTVASSGGQISPEGTDVRKPLGTASTFSAFAIAPSYLFRNFTLTINGKTTAIQSTDLGYNQVTITPNAYGIQEDDKVVLTANFADVKLRAGTQTLSASLNCESGAAGNYTVSTVYAKGKTDENGNAIVPLGTTLSDRQVTTSASLPSTTIDGAVGILFNFRPSSGSYVKSVTVNGKEASFQGTSFLIGAAGQNLVVRVTYARGQQPQVDQKEITVKVEKRPNGNYPATLGDGSGSVVGEATYPVNEGGMVTIDAQPYKDMYRLSHVNVYSPPDATQPSDIVNHVYVSPNGSDGVTYDKDQITLYNVTSDVRIELIYEIMPAFIEVEAGEGGSWGWIPGDGAVVVDANNPSRVAPAKVRAKAASANSGRLVDQIQYGNLDLTKEHAYARLVIYEQAGYELGNVLINGNRVNNLLKSRTDDQGRTYYTLVVFLGEAGSADASIGAVPEEPDNPDNIFYTSSNRTRVSMTFNPSIIPAPTFNTITTAVTSFGGGTVTPTRNVEEGGTAVIEFFPDAGYKVENVWLDDVLLDNYSAELSSDRLKVTLQNVRTSHHVLVSFTPGDQQNGDKARYNITATAGVGGSITPAGTFPVYGGTTQQFVLAPGTGYQVSQIRIDGAVMSDNDSDVSLNGNTLEIRNVQKDRSVSVTFRKAGDAGAATYVVNANKTGKGTISPSEAVIVGAGGDVNYTIIPEQGWYVQDVRAYYANTGSTNGISLYSLYDKTTFTFKLSDVREDATVTAVFAEGDENGKIPGTVDPDVPGSGDPVPTPPAEGDKIEIDPPSINPDTTPGAVVTPSPDELEIIKEPGTNHGASDLTFTVTVMDGYELNSPVRGNGIIVRNDEEGDISDKVTMNQVGDGVWTVTVPKGSVTSSLKMEVNTHPKQSSTENVDLKKVSLSVAGDGYITPGMLKVGDKTGTVQVENGKNQTFNFLAADGWKLHTVYLNGKPTTVSGNVLTLHGIQQDTTIEAVFSKLGPDEPQPPKPKTWNVTILQGNNGEVSPSGTVAVIDGSSLTISAEPKPGYKAVAKVDGADVPVLGNSIELAKVSKNTTVNIDFEQIVQTQYRTLSITSTGPGTTSPAGTSLVVDGKQQTVTLIPDEGKKVKSVIVNGVSMIGEVDAAHMSLNLGAITSNTTVNVEFCDVTDLRPTDPGYNLPPSGQTTVYYNVTTSSPNGGGIVLPASAKVARGGGVELTMMPNNGYELESVTVNGADRTSRVDPAGTLSLTNITADTVVSAKFKKTQTSDLEDFYTVFVSCGEGGSVSPAGALTVAAGGSQTITIMPDPGYKIRDITVDNVSSGKGFAGSAYTLFNVTKDQNVVVSFEKGSGGSSVLTHDVIATSTVNGRVSPEGTTKVADGKNASFTFVPNAGYKLSYVTVDGVDVPAQYIVNNQYVFTDVRENHSLHAVFADEGQSAEEYVTVSVDRALNGTVSPSDSVLVPVNGDAEFTVTPFYGYQVDDILIDGTSIGRSNILSGALINNAQVQYSNGHLKLLTVNRDKKVTARFSKKLITPGDPDSPTYVPVTGDTSSNPANSGAGGTTSIGDGGYMEEPGDGASDAEKWPHITITPDPGSMIDKVEVTYGDGSKTVVTDDGKFEYDGDGNLVDSSGTPVTDGSGNNIKYPNVGSPARPTSPTPTSEDIFKQGYIEVDGEKAAETGGLDVDVTFRPQTDQEKTDIENGTLIPATYYEINATYSGGGRMFPEGRVKVASGQNMIFQMLPSSGYELASLSVDGRDAMNDVTNSRKYIFNTVAGNRSINAVFGFTNGDIQHYNVTASSNVDGGVSPAATTVPKGSDAVVYLFPPAGQKVANVTVTKDGAEVLNTSDFVQPMYTATNVDGNIDVRVTYETAGPDEPTWTVESVRVTANTPGGNGKVSPSEATVPVGSPQTFFFEPEPGYVVDYVLFNDVSTELRNNPASFTVTPSKGAENNLAVYFKEATSRDKQFTTVRPVVNGGHATVDPRSMNVEVGSSVQFYVSPENGYTIDSVKVDGWDVSFRPALPEGVPAQTGAEYTTYLVTIDNVQPGANVEINTKTTSKRPIEIKKHQLTVNGENVMYTPMGILSIPEGGKQEITIDPLPGYYLDSIMVTEKDASGNAVGEPVDMTDSVKDNKFTVSMGNYDKEVYIRYLMVGGDEKPTPAYVTLGSTKMEDGRDVDASISLQRSSDGMLVPLTIDPVTRKLLGTDGNPLEFVRGGVYTFYASAPAVDGKQVILSSATYNGNAQSVPNLTGMVANVKLSANGTLDLVFRELKDGEKPIVTQEFDVRFEVIGGQGSITPDVALAGITVQMGNSTGAVAMTPASDHWMIGSVVERYFDKDGNQIGEPVEVDPRRYKDETYDCKPSCNTVVQVEFVECAIVDVQWDKSLGFVSPNPATSYLKLEASRLGDPYAFVVAPFEDCYVESFTVTPEGGETTSCFSDLKQTQAAADYIAAGGYNVVDFTLDGGVTAPDEAALQAMSNDNATYAVQASAARAAGDFDPIEYNGFIPEKGTTMQNAYSVQTMLDPNKTTVRVGLYTTRAALQNFTITPSVKGTGGRISPSIPVTVKGGLDQTFNLIADNGYSVKAVLIDGSPITGDQLGTNGTSYTFFNVDRDHTIEVEFGPITSSESQRLLRVASSLARTGDLAGPAIGCLLLVAAAGLMVTAVSYIRRRNRRRQRYQQ